VFRAEYPNLHAGSKLEIRLNPAELFATCFAPDESLVCWTMPVNINRCFEIEYATIRMLMSAPRLIIRRSMCDSRSSMDRRRPASLSPGIIPVSKTQATSVAGGRPKRNSGQTPAPMPGAPASRRPLLYAARAALNSDAAAQQFAASRFFTLTGDAVHAAGPPAISRKLSGVLAEAGSQPQPRE
jgi:hypothetical protein